MTGLTLMAVHAHPDDESISTGGILARYGSEGVRTVLVTCTDGGCGDSEGGLKPGDDGYDRDAVVAERRKELQRSCEVLGISDLELLGYRDSGMMGWPQNDEPGSFWTTPVDAGAARVAELIRRYQPEVVLTYDPNGFYGHPDHIQAHRITVAALDSITSPGTSGPAKLYYPTVPRSRMRDFGARLRALGVDLPDPEDGPREEWGTPDEEVTTFVDVSAVADQKYDSLACHKSQSDNLFFLKMGREVFAQMMGTEAFVRVRDRTGAPLPETDLFAGLRLR